MEFSTKILNLCSLEQQFGVQRQTIVSNNFQIIAAEEMSNKSINKLFPFSLFGLCLQILLLMCHLFHVTGNMTKTKLADFFSVKLTASIKDLLAGTCLKEQS